MTSFTKLIIWSLMHLIFVTISHLQPIDALANVSSAANYNTMCDKMPKRKQKACKMVLEMWHESRKAEREGRLLTKEELPPPSHGLGLPTYRAATRQELDAQPPPKVVDERYACMNMTCLCPHLGGVSLAPDQCSRRAGASAASRLRADRDSGKALRMEYRMLSDNQRARFHAALKQLKRGFGSYEYDRLSALHSDPKMMPSAHAGPTFLPWHREYLKRMEIALRAIDPSVAIPYWDSSLDGRLPNPLDSIMWSNLFMGSTDDYGQIADGDFAGWRTSSGNLIQRTPGADGQLMTEADIVSMITERRPEHIFGFLQRPLNSGCSLPNPGPLNMLEIIHTDVHIWIGGDMLALNTASQDPVFFLHHSFIDYIWEQWRLKWQNRQQRATQFPQDSQIVPCSGSANYRLSATMRPFLDPVVLNKDGLSNAYTDNLYAYAPRPSCRAAGGCGSPYLFCDTIRERPLCCAKIKPGGDCSTFIKNSEQPCFASKCIKGVCQKSMNTATNLSTTRGSSLATSTPSPTPSPPRERFCFDNHECCAQWTAKNACRTAPRYMNTWCPGSCRFDGCRLHPELPPQQQQQHPTASTNCKDRHSQCERWAHFHETRAGAVHGKRWHVYAPGNRRVPKTNTARLGECERNAHWMLQNCAKACGHCKVAIGTSPKCRCGE
uniref:ShKT domain-containing protein n=1 Tax=Globodera rostochiensis TaxID=31243 RepID=A0A914H5F4_GLORO